MSMSPPSMPPPDYGRIWAQYGGALQNQEQSYLRNVSLSRARMAASGMEPGSDQWNKNLENMAAQQEKAVSDLRGGAMGSFLQQGFQSYQMMRNQAMRSATRPADFRKEAMTPEQAEAFVTERVGPAYGSMEEWAAGQFGKPWDTEQAQSPEAQALERARAAGRGGGALINPAQQGPSERGTGVKQFQLAQAESLERIKNPWV